MSIIHEALKKAGQGIVSKPAKASASSEIKSTPKEFRVDYDHTRSRYNWGPIFIISVLLLVTGPIVVPIFSTTFKQEPRIESDETGLISGIEEIVGDSEAFLEIPAEIGASENIRSTDVVGDLVLPGSIQIQNPTPPAPATFQSQFRIEERPNAVLAAQAAMPFVAPTLPNFYLSGIVFSPEESYCILNGTVVQIGGSIQGAKLVAVHKEYVTLEINNQRMDVRLS